MASVKGMKRTAEHNAKIAAAHKARGRGESPTKVCPRCKVEKPRADFKVRANGYTHSYCLPCERAYGAERARRHLARHPELAEHRARLNRKTQLRRKYGITVEEYDAMLERQGGTCAICGGQPTRGRAFFDVDHCHDSQRVRGLLCSACNTTIGLAGDDPARLRAAADYLAGAHRE